MIPVSALIPSMTHPAYGRGDGFLSREANRSTTTHGKDRRTRFWS
jgi:hypothetical protein